MATNTHALPVLVRIGKQGITPGIIEEIKKQASKRKTIKVKFLPAHARGKDKRKFAKMLAQMTNTKLKSQTGFVIVLEQNDLNTPSTSG